MTSIRIRGARDVVSATWKKISGRKFSRDVARAIGSVNSREKNGGIRRAPRGQVADLVSWVLLGPGGLH